MKAHVVGGGIASLTAAAYLIKDAGLLGSNIHIYEMTDAMGGALDAGGSPETGYVMRGGRMFEEKYQCTRELLSFIPAIHDANKSVTQDIDDFYETSGWYDKARLIDKHGIVVDATHFGLTHRDRLELMELCLRPEATLGGKRIADCFSPAFFATNFWYMLATIYAFVPWHSAMEMRRYLLRFVHLLPSMATMAAVQRTRFNQYEAIVKPLTDWLGRLGVHLVTGTRVTNVDFRPSREGITANRLYLSSKEEASEIEVAADDLVFVTNGSMVADASFGSMTRAPQLISTKTDGSWTLWEKLARGRSDFGNPAVFCDHVNESAWESFTFTSRGPLLRRLMEELSGQAAGRGGLMTLKESNWLLTITMFHPPHFTGQPDDVSVGWGYGLYIDRPGNYVNKPMKACTGAEILEEAAGHLNFTAHLDEIRESSICIPCMLPYAGSVFMPRSRGDRPEVVPRGSTNFAFLGQFTEMPDDTVFTVEYSVRSGREAVSTLLGLRQRPPSVYKGEYDFAVLREVIKALHA